MEHGIRPVHEFGEEAAIEDRVDHVLKFPVTFQGSDVFDVSCRKVVNHRYSIAPAQERLCKVRADEPGPSGN